MPANRPLIASDLRRRIRIEERTTVRDEYGGETTTWGYVADVAASIEPLTGRDYVAAQQAQSRITARIRIRYLPGITSEMRVRYGDTIYAINGPPIDPEER